MDNLEKYIKDNREMFDSGELPEGGRERFLMGLEQSCRAEKHQSRKRFYIFASVAGIAAAVLLVFFIGTGRNEEGTRPEHYMAILTTLDMEITNLSKECDERTAAEITRASKSVIHDAIPFEEQLPEDMPEEEKEIIMKGYYEKKVEGLKRIKENLIAYNQTN